MRAGLGLALVFDHAGRLTVRGVLPKVSNFIKMTNIKNARTSGLDSSQKTAAVPQTQQSGCAKDRFRKRLLFLIDALSPSLAAPHWLSWSQTKGERMSKPQKAKYSKTYAL